MTSLKPLSSPTLAERTVDLIRKRILGGGFASGERLVETQLAKQLQISRGPLREALKQLAAEGLVREEPRRGTFVTAPTSTDVRDVYDLRAAIEARAARLVIRRRDPQASEGLRRALGRLRAAVGRSDLRELVRTDFEFHETLCRVSGNGRLHEVFVRNASVLRVLIQIEEGQFYRSFEEVEHQHQELLASIEAGDEAKAAQLVVRHLEDARDRLLSYLAQTAEAPATPVTPGPARPAAPRRGRSRR
ncbi:MAG TPA: GntR family transcriptional regulator [Actinomycetes bacterium]|nr:GntR family transcriptional regulator [Actinomycetes bacterium]